MIIPNSRSGSIPHERCGTLFRLTWIQQWPAILRHLLPALAPDGSEGRLPGVPNSISRNATQNGWEKSGQRIQDRVAPHLFLASQSLVPKTCDLHEPGRSNAGTWANRSDSSIRESCFPSPRPSPRRRGRNIRHLWTRSTLSGLREVLLGNSKDAANHEQGAKTRRALKVQTCVDDCSLSPEGEG